MLTDTAIRKVKPTDKPQRMFDGGGLYLEVSPAGGKWWRLVPYEWPTLQFACCLESSTDIDGSSWQ